MLYDKFLRKGTSYVDQDGNVMKYWGSLPCGWAKTEYVFFDRRGNCISFTKEKLINIKKA